MDEKGGNMKDINIVIQQPDGSEITVSTGMIEEDVIRRRCGLDEIEVED